MEDCNGRRASHVMARFVARLLCRIPSVIVNEMVRLVGEAQAGLRRQSAPWACAGNRAVCDLLRGEAAEDGTFHCLRGQVFVVCLCMIITHNRRAFYAKEYQTLSWPCFGQVPSMFPSSYSLARPLWKRTVARQVSAGSDFRPSSFFGTSAGRNCFFNELSPRFSVAQYRRVARARDSDKAPELGIGALCVRIPAETATRNTPPSATHIGQSQPFNRRSWGRQIPVLAATL